MENPYDSAENLDQYASAAGLMQLRSAVAVANAANCEASDSISNDICSYSNSCDSSTVFSSSDRTLPPDWHRIIHDSGLPCYVHEKLRIVCWTRPYPLNLSGHVTLSQKDLDRFVKQHVPPVSIFTSESDVADRKRNYYPGANDIVLKKSLPPFQEARCLKKRKLDVATNVKKKIDKQQALTLEEFKTLDIGDPRVLQACMELSVKTPAQVLQEYQNRNRGVSINYNTISVDGEGVKLFKTIVTAGSTVAEGVASTKKIAKQLGAQQLLAALHERTANKYHEVADMYNSSLKGQSVISEEYVNRTAIPLVISGRSGRTGNVDPRLQRGGGVLYRGRRARRSPPFQESGAYRGYTADRRSNASPHWEVYNHEKSQYIPQPPGTWTVGSQQSDSGVGNVGPERVVVYSQAAARNAESYGGGRHYNSGGKVWGSYPDVNHPMPDSDSNLSVIHPHLLNNGALDGNQLPPERGSFNYGSMHERSLDRPTTSTPKRYDTDCLKPLPALIAYLSGLSMEGFLLVFSKEQRAKVQYCVLENGMLRCLDRPGGVLHESVGLTRHRIRVEPLFADNAGVCPNRFAVHALEVKRNDHEGAFVATSKRERIYYFAAVTSKSMIKWADAIHNWRRHAFNDPKVSVMYAFGTVMDEANRAIDAKHRAFLLETQRLHLVNMANRFDVQLISPNTKTTRRPSGLFRMSLLCVSSAYKSIKTTRSSLPSFLGCRVCQADE
ncbi:hypothetical protein CCR75_008918 [Bremia lactucae]|uniref:WW domain-containing protein n=1 Tax=Bremia lactucae TaxID=4779 RepID=A0A976NZ85_BRELC|nr:hypothetical protein CCR75_008918 [Bremia lactucae]